jgi:hypothetical protein
MTTSTLSAPVRRSAARSAGFICSACDRPNNWRSLAAFDRRRGRRFCELCIALLAILQGAPDGRGARASNAH